MTKPAFEVIEAEYCYVAWSNTDCTEGRGYEYPIAVSWNEETAKRHGKGKYVMGSNCRVTKEVALKVSDGSITGKRWLAPVRFETETEADRKAQAKKFLEESRKQKREEAIKKAKELGLSDEDLKALSD